MQIKVELDGASQDPYKFTVPLPTGPASRVIVNRPDSPSATLLLQYMSLSRKHLDDSGRMTDSQTNDLPLDADFDRR